MYSFSFCRIRPNLSVCRRVSIWCHPYILPSFTTHVHDLSYFVLSLLGYGVRVLRILRLPFFFRRVLWPPRVYQIRVRYLVLGTVALRPRSHLLWDLFSLFLYPRLFSSYVGRENYFSIVFFLYRVVRCLHEVRNSLLSLLVWGFYGHPVRAFYGVAQTCMLASLVGRPIVVSRPNRRYFL